MEKITTQAIYEEIKRLRKDVKEMMELIVPSVEPKADERLAAKEGRKEIQKGRYSEWSKVKRKIGICGEAPSTFMDFAEFLVKCGIDSISLNPDSVIKTTITISKLEQKLHRKRKH